MLPCNVSVRNPVCNTDKPIVKYVRKFIFESVSIRSVLPGKPIRDSNVCSSKLVSACSVLTSKPIQASNVRLSKPITSSIARPSKLVTGSNACSAKPVSVSSICPSKQTCGRNVCPSKTFSVGNVCSSNSVSAINIPLVLANIRLDEDVLKTSLVFVFRRRLQDVFKSS